MDISKQSKPAKQVLEDELDIAVYEEAYAEYIETGKKSRPIEELWKELDQE